MSLRQKAVSGVIWSAIESWGRQLISSLVFFLLARLLGPETFGLVALASVCLAFIQLFLDQGLSQAIIQRKDLDPEHLDTAFWTNLGISSLLTLWTIFLAGWMASLFNQPALTPIIRCLSLSFLFGSFSSVQQAILRRNLAFKVLAKRALIAVVVAGAASVVMAFLGYGVWSLVGYQLINGFVQVLVLWWVSDWRPKYKFSKKHFRELFSFGINVMGLNIADFINRRSDDLLIGYFLGPVALGYYSVAYRLLVITTDLLTGITAKVAMPTFSKLQEEPERLRQAFYTTTQLTSLVAFPCFLGMAALAPELVTVLFGPKWMPSIPVMQILSFIGIIHSIYFFNGTIMMALGKPSWRLALNCLNAVANIIGFLIAVQWGIEAVAASYVIRGYVLSPLPLLVIRKLAGIDLKFYFSQLVSQIIGALGLAISILGFKLVLKDILPPPILLIVLAVLGTIVYGLIILLLAPQLFNKILDLLRLVLPGRMSKKA